MGIAQTFSTPVPPILVNPSVIEKVVKKKTGGVEKPTRSMAQIMIPSLLPVEVQLSREHLKALKDEISAAEDVLHNVYEDIDLFSARQAALNEITMLLVRMRNCVDELSIGVIGREAIRGEIDLLKKQVDYIIDTAEHRSVPVLKPFQKLVVFPGDDENKNQADVVFIVDRSTDMKKDIGMLRKTVHVLYRGLQNRGVDVMMGLQTYERNSQPSGPLRSEIGEFISDIESIYFNGKTRNSLTAIKEALTDQSFRPGSFKFLILFTDDEAHDDYGAARDDVAELARNSGAAIFALSENEHLTGLPIAVYESLARQTGGNYLNMSAVPYEENMSRIASNIVEFMMKRGASVSVTSDRLIHIGPESSDRLTVRFPELTSEGIGLKDLPLGTADDFSKALESIDKALDKITMDRNDKNILQNYLNRILGFFDSIRVFKLDFTI
ncbi:MAG TPA: VWA domain-containing protein [bacterium]|nr:VWA domain-containing protein [bacterium]